MNQQIHLVPPDLDPESNEPLDSEPRSVRFVTEGVQLGAEDPSMIILRRKQALLAAIHERLDHLSSPSIDG
jgi:hypothetical protein